MNKKLIFTDYSKTLYLPKTKFPMKANLPKIEIELINRWEKIKLYKKLRENAINLPHYVLHDGPPYANGKIHIGHALNKILKDVIIKSYQMRGYNANYIIGWDCHGLPIEWKVEKKYRDLGKNKHNIPINKFRKECRNFANYWINEQKKDFKRLGIIADFDNPYTTMDFHSEAQIANELINIASNGQIYRKSKPVMWSIVENTALSDAEIEYHDYISDSLFIEFPIKNENFVNTSILIWTTTPWTIPGNRAVAFSSQLSYSMYNANIINHNCNKKLIFAETAEHYLKSNKNISLKKIKNIKIKQIETIELFHPLKDLCKKYNFIVPLLDSAHVKHEKGTGFVHIAPSHGQEDFDIWIKHTKILKKRGIDINIPTPVDNLGFYTNDAPKFGPDRKEGAARVFDEQGNIGNANNVVIKELKNLNKILQHNKIKHSYPHSWRSKKPVILINTPQWFMHMDKKFVDGTTLRDRALREIRKIKFIPYNGYDRLYSMIKNRPDWVLSRQRKWGVPIPIFFKQNGQILNDKNVNLRIINSFMNYGSDIWFDENAKKFFLGNRINEGWEMVCDILDVWFDSGSSHAFVLEKRNDTRWPADIYLEGSDQHRGWFNASILESCATRNKAPFSTLITHGFTLDEKGKKMSKSIGNFISPQDIIKNFGADILRLWATTIDYCEDQKLGKNTIKTSIDSYRKLRNIFRWMLGILYYDNGIKIPYDCLPSLEQFMLNRLYEINSNIKSSYDQFNFKNVVRTLLDFAIIELSSFYFDIRKDTLYCDPPSSKKRFSSLQTIREIFNNIIIWLAPILPFTTEEVWLTYKPNSDSIHLEKFLNLPNKWNNKKLSDKWHIIKLIRKVVLGAIEVERSKKNIKSSLEASPIIFIKDYNLLSIIKDIDLEEICITSYVSIINDFPPEKAFYIKNIKDIAVIIKKSDGRKCLRSWRYTKDVGKDPNFPDISERDAQSIKELIDLGHIF